MAIHYPADWLDELRSRADIVQIISGYVPLKKNGRKHWGLCPFHGEKTASFSVDQERQLYYCFGCKASGTVINFVMDMERLDFPEAVKYLAEQVHMPLPQLQEDPGYQQRKQQRERLLECNRQAARIFHENLFKPQGAAALEYLKNRGLSDSVIRKFGLGAAPDGWDHLTKQLLALGYREEELQKVGLTVIREAETLPDGLVKPRRAFDMFRNRAMFPIIDQYGNVLGFGGRVLGKGEPKYLNTSDTPVFNKRLGVYAANLLRKERQLDRVILVEGYMDVVALTQFGIKGVCATLGTALTNEQARLLKRFAPAVYLSYDGDSAGQHAILRGLDILEAEGIPAKVLDFPDKLDPDEFIRRDGPEAFEKLPALSPAAYRMRRLKEQFDLSTSDGRTAYAKACAPILKKLDPIDLENHLRELALQTGFSREVLLAQVDITAPTPTAQPAREKPPTLRKPGERRSAASVPMTEDLRAQEQLISILATGQVPADIVTAEDFEDPFLQELFAGLSAGRSAASLAESLHSQPQVQERAGRLLMTPPSDGTDQLIRMAHECVLTLRRSRLERSLAEKRSQLTSASSEEKRQLLPEITAMTAALAKLRNQAQEN